MWVALLVTATIIASLVAINWDAYSYAASALQSGYTWIIIGTLGFVFLPLFFWGDPIPSAGSARRRDRTLVILDMNNFLVWRLFDAELEKNRPLYAPILHHAAHLGQHMTWRRKGLDEFIDFLLANFDVAVWSSAWQKNVTLLCDHVFGDKRDQLIFEFDQTHCGVVKPHPTPGETKPLFIKNLDTVWREFPGVYTRENTLMIDDSPLKARENPVGSLYQVYPWYPLQGKGLQDDGLEEIQAVLAAYLRDGRTVPEFFTGVKPQREGNRVEIF